MSFYEATKKYSKLYGSENNGNLGWRLKSQIPTLFVGHLDKLEKNEDYLLENGLLKEEDMSLDNDRHTLIMTKLVEIMIQSIECWYYARDKNETNMEKDPNSFIYGRNSGE